MIKVRLYMMDVRQGHSAPAPIELEFPHEPEMRRPLYVPTRIFNSDWREYITQYAPEAVRDEVITKLLTKSVMELTLHGLTNHYEVGDSNIVWLCLGFHVVYPTPKSAY